MSPWLSPATLRNLSDKLYEKRKAAALEVEQARLRTLSPNCVGSLVRMPDALPGAGDQSAGCGGRPDQRGARERRAAAVAACGVRVSQAADMRSTSLPGRVNRPPGR